MVVKEKGFRWWIFKCCWIRWSVKNQEIYKWRGYKRCPSKYKCNSPRFIYCSSFCCEIRIFRNRLISSSATWNLNWTSNCKFKKNSFTLGSRMQPFKSCLTIDWCWSKSKLHWFWWIYSFTFSISFS